MAPAEEGGAPEEVDAEEYNVWKKNSPFLYDLLISHPLEWPSLTVQWLPRSSSSSSAAGLLLGTHTAGDAPNFLMVSDAQLASPPSGSPSSIPPIPTVQVTQLIRHEGEVNRARYMPQNPSLVATKTCGSEVHVFDCGRRPLRPGEGESCSPEVVLKGHTKEGYGVSWSPFREGFLLSGSYDCRICLWDVSLAPKSGSVLEARDVLEVHESLVEDVAWHSKNENLFGSVGDDRALMIWDLRSAAASTKPQQSVLAHEDEVNSLCFSPWNEWILATASADTTINLFDMRKLTTSLHTFSGHTEAVLQVEWSPKHETILASSSDDRKLMIWDLNRVGDEQMAEDAEDGPPELLFVHSGHTGKISEFSWNPNEPWLISSVADDNILQVWQMAESIYLDDNGTPADDAIYALA